MKHLLFALALTIGSLPACTPLDVAARERLIEYAHAIFNIPINDSFRIAEEKPDPKTCYTEITLTDSTSDEPLRRILFVSPDHRFLTTTLYDVDAAARPVPAVLNVTRTKSSLGLAGDELEIEASISLLGPVDPSIGPFRFALTIVPGANRATGIALSAGSSSAGPPILSLRSGQASETFVFRVATSAKNTQAGTLNYGIGANLMSGPPGYAVTFKGGDETTTDTRELNIPVTSP